MTTFKKIKTTIIFDQTEQQNANDMLKTIGSIIDLMKEQDLITFNSVTFDYNNVDNAMNILYCITHGFLGKIEQEYTGED